MLTKKQAVSAIKSMPDKFDITELFDRLLLIDKIEVARQQIKDGKGLSPKQSKFTKAFKTELNRRVQYYLDGGEMVTPGEMTKRLGANRKKKQI